MRALINNFSKFSIPISLRPLRLTHYKYYLIILLCLALKISSAQQHRIHVNAKVDTVSNALSGVQHIEYINLTPDTLKQIYLYAWANGYKDSYTDLGIRFLENFRTDFYYSKLEDRGWIDSLSFKLNGKAINYHFSHGQRDVLFLRLEQGLPPGQKVDISTSFKLYLPNAKFTGYGFEEGGKQMYKYWYMVPAVYSDGKWIKRSNKNLNDLYTNPYYFSAYLSLPKNRFIISDVNVEKVAEDERFNKYFLFSNSTIRESEMIIDTSKFKNYQFAFNGKKMLISTDHKPKNDEIRIDTVSHFLRRQVGFMQTYFGEWPFHRLMITQNDLKNNKVHGLLQIPILDNYDPEFLYDIHLFRVLIKQMIERILISDIRREAWFSHGLETFLFQKYLDKYYPEVPLFGKVTQFKIARYFHMSKLKFRDRYWFAYLYIARLNQDQALDTSLDSLVNWNINTAMRFKSAMGFELLERELGEDRLQKLIFDFYISKRDTRTKPEEFVGYLQQNSKKDLSWFSEDYIHGRNRLDYKLVKATESPGFTELKIQNKGRVAAPFSVSAYKGDSLRFYQWYSGIEKEGSINLPGTQYSKIIVNQNYDAPEFNLNNNVANPGKLFKKKTQLRFYEDADNPEYHQMFFVPIANWNAYDGLGLGINLYNESLIPKPLRWSIAPTYSFRSKSVTGSTGAYYRFLPNHRFIQQIQIGAFASYSHYEEDLYYIKATPSIRLNFVKKYPRSNLEQSILLRDIYVNRERPDEENFPIPDNNDLPLDGGLYEYNIINGRYTLRSRNILDDYRLKVDWQHASTFGKFQLEFDYRFKTPWKQNFQFRTFFGKFYFNNNETNYFNFGSDRSSDYLFDYYFLGRSETEGFLSQQIVISDGGFKTRFNRFSDDWMWSSNFSMSLWKFLEVYGDIGVMGYSDRPVEFLWDTGFRINIVPDFMELYFPIYSSNGADYKARSYATSIRYVVNLNFSAIWDHLRRTWY